jgi:uncharacterized sporulation protein YeaH/YhbH (DUF444 family)
MLEDKIDSNESEGFYNEFVKDRIEDKIEEIIEAGIETDGSEIVVELGDIESPTFTYGDPEDGKGSGTGGPGRDSGGLKFSIPFDKFMEMVAKKFKLPNLCKEGKGKIKDISHEWKTYGPTGSILDKKRTYKRALKSNIAMGNYSPKDGKFDFQIRKRDKRYKLPEIVEKPKYKAVVMFIGDVSYSTYGQRLEQEKKYVAFIQNWINYNYGKKNVDYRYFVHEAKAYEVSHEDFYRATNSGGTMASPSFELASDIATNEYDVDSTNLYLFYFGDGELFDDDADNIAKIINEKGHYFNRIGITEVLPHYYSILHKTLDREVSSDLRSKRVSLAIHGDPKDIIKNIKLLFK